MFKLVVVFVTLIFLEINLLTAQKVLNFEPDSLTLEVNQKDCVSINLVNAYNHSVNINFTYGDENKEYPDTRYIKPISPIVFAANTTTSMNIDIEGVDVGHIVIGAKSNDIDIPFSDIFRVDVIHSKILNIVITVIGWIYFFSWSISFYPQVFLNWKLKDVSGLSFDFIFLNFLGHTCYLIFNLSLYYIKAVQHEYFKQHPRGVNPVLLNDLFFSIHASLITLVTIIQSLYYRKTNKTVSRPTMLILLGFILFLITSGVACYFTDMSILLYVYFFSYVKLAITLMKYIPQAYKNYKRKSTLGWSILNVLLDFTGGSLSLLQMFLLSYNYNDWSSIFGSPTKFGLGMFSILFDIVFIVQHYCLYNRRSDAEFYAPIA